MINMLFRGYIKERNEIRKVISINFDTGVVKVDGLDEEFIWGDSIEVDRYSKVKDKNGVMIYENDIVEAYIDLGPAGEMKTQITIGRITHTGINIQPWTFEEEWSKPVVIGNIHTGLFKEDN